MFKEDFNAASGAAAAKSSFLKKNPVGYFVLSVLAGMYIGFGILLSFTTGGLLAGEAAAKLAMGATFGVALSLVVMAGSELFTGNNMVMVAGLFKNKVTFADCLVLWIVCWLGNMCGGVLLAILYHLTGLGNGTVGDFMAKTAMAKMSAPAIALLTRGILCNMLVCIAVWCGFRCKSESGKLIMIFWCLITFFTTGFEHSVANMTLLTYSLFNSAGQAVSLSGELYNLFWVTLGNMIGGIGLVAVPYFLSQRDI